MSERGSEQGPDCHAVLVPRPKSVNGLSTIANRLGITVIEGTSPESWRGWKGPAFHPELPSFKHQYLSDHREEWPQRCPDLRCKLPDYVPDVEGGKPSPVALTEWKIAALKAQIVLETRGRLTRTDFKALKLSPSRWTQFWLRADGNGGWINAGSMPDFKAQHPVNYEQIKADFAKWAPPAQPTQPTLLTGAA